MKSRHFLNASVVAALATVLASPAAAGERMVFAKPGATAAELQRETADCVVRAAKMTFKQTYGAGGLVGIGIMAAIQPSMDKEKRENGVEICLARRGYGHLALTEGEASAFGAAQTDEARRAWLDGFMAGDIAGRVREAVTPPTLDLPHALDADAPFSVGAAHIDPASLTLAGGPVRVGDEVLGGTLSRRAVAILQEDVRMHAGIRLMHAQAGTLFQEYVLPRDADPQVSEENTLWCAMFTGQGFAQPLCFRNTLHGYQFYLADGKAWFAGPTWAEPWIGYFKSRIILAVQPQDPAPPLRFSLAVQLLRKEGVLLKAVARGDKGSIEFAHVGAKFDNAGKARIAFWDRDLVLTRAGDGVTATFEPRAEDAAQAVAP